jgi:hypothetical protein
MLKKIGIVKAHHDWILSVNSRMDQDILNHAKILTLIFSHKLNFLTGIIVFSQSEHAAEVEPGVTAGVTTATVLTVTVLQSLQSGTYNFVVLDTGLRRYDAPGKLAPMQSLTGYKETPMLTSCVKQAFKPG